MSNREVIEATGLFRASVHSEQTETPQLGELFIMRSCGRLELTTIPSEETLERVSGIASSLYDTLSKSECHEQEAEYLFDLCIHIAEAGGSDAEIGHTAVEYIKNFPDIYEEIEIQASHQPRQVHRVGNAAINSF